MRPKFDLSKLPPKPNFTGNLCIKDHPIQEIVELIVWIPFFQVYQVRGKYPNCDYPANFKDECVGPEAKTPFAEATEILEWVVKENILSATGAIGIHPANSVDDDIEVHADENRDRVVQKFYGLRQQLAMSEPECKSQTDFISPKDVALDYIAAFTCTGGLGCHKQRQKFEEKGEIDKAILLEAIADRLAEVFAEFIHLKIRQAHRWQAGTHRVLHDAFWCVCLRPHICAPRSTVLCSRAGEH
jgi:5-methyltetrahydrofolate--homocysteine methyltransferase